MFGSPQHFRHGFFVVFGRENYRLIAIHYSDLLSQRAAAFINCFPSKFVSSRIFRPCQRHIFRVNKVRRGP
jgi:hypothetical protein